MTLRPMTAGDFDEFFALYEAVAAEGRWIGGELPLDRDDYRRRYEATFADDRWLRLFADVDGRAVGWIDVEHQRHGRGELGMAVLDGHRSRGVGTALMAAGVDWARARGVHKLTLELFSHNERALGLYEKFGFVVEGRLRRHWRRNDGSLWDSIAMGLVLDETSPGSPHA